MLKGVNVILKKRKAIATAMKKITSKSYLKKGGIEPSQANYISTLLPISYWTSSLLVFLIVGTEFFQTW